MNIRPGNCNKYRQQPAGHSSAAVLVLAFFALSSLFSILAFFIALLALLK